MTYPVYIGDRAAGTMTVTAAGQDTVFELRCPDPEPGLWRAWVQGEEGRLDLGILEGGRAAPPVFPPPDGLPGRGPVGRGGALREPGACLAPRRTRGLSAAPAAGGHVPPGGAAAAAGPALWRGPALSPDGAVLPGPDPDHGRPALGGIPLSGPGPGAPGRKVKFGSTIIRRYVV